MMAELHLKLRSCVKNRECPKQKWRNCWDALSKPIPDTNLIQQKFRWNP